MDRRRVLAAVPAGECRWLPYWLFAAGVFVVGAALGGAVGAERETTVLFPVRSPGDPVTDVSGVELFLHNLRVALTMLAGGVLAGIPTLYMLFFNGFTLGSVAVDAAGTLGLVTTLVLLLPHGVVELPAIWLAGAIPARWLHVGWNLATGRDRTTPVPLVLGRTVVALLAGVQLLAIAAVLEATVTVALARTL